MERSYVSDAPLIVRNGPRDRGDWKGKTEILETENLGTRLEWRDRDEI